MRKMTPISKYVAYRLPNSNSTYTFGPAPSSRKKDETEDDWLKRAIERFIPIDAIDMQILSD